MAKILNIDSFAKEERFIKLNGVEYKINEMTVSNFIETAAQAEKLNDAPVFEQVEGTIQMVKRSIPDVSEDILRSIPLESLQTIVSFIRGEHLVEGVEDTETAKSVKKKTTAKKATVKA